MALKSPDTGQLKSPDTGQFKQLVQVNGLSYNQYERVAHRIEVGHAVRLERDSSNPHDRKTVKVLYSGHQIGWVPRAVNDEIARRMDAGEQLDARVILHRQTAKQLEIEVLGLPRTPLGSVPMHAVNESNSSSNSGYAAGVMNRAKGIYFNLRTNTTRSSVSLDIDGSCVAWFDKGHLSDKALVHVLGGCCTATRDGDKLYLWGARPQSAGGHITADQLSAGSLQSIIGIKAGALHVSHTITDADGTERRVDGPMIQNESITQPQKENTMNFSSIISKTVNLNKDAAAAAGYLEAGRIANKKIGQVAAKSLPMMARGYADTGLGRLLIANAAAAAAAQLRPNDPTLGKLTMAMVTAAYQEVIQEIDIEGMLDSLLDSPEIKKAVSKLPPDEKI